MLVKKRIKLVSLLLSFAFTIVLASSVVPVYAADEDNLRQLFDRLDQGVSNGDWYIGYNNETGTLAWGEARVMRAYLCMYQVTGDIHYLDKFVKHADSVLKMRDSIRGVTDYRGLSLPAWRSGDLFTKGRGYYLYAVHTGMIAYPFAGFAKIVYSNPSLANYKSNADTYLQAAKDAVFVHEADFVDNGTTGYYRDPKGCPEGFDGLGIPFNQYLAMARAELILYEVTKEKPYLDRVTKMANHFKSYLETDQSTNSYQWRYWWGPGFDGYTAADYLSTNTPFYPGLKGYEDITHGEIDVDFAYLAFKDGIVFNKSDMQQFGNTVEKKMLHSDGNVAILVNGEGTIDENVYIGGWLRYHKYAPSLFNYFKEISSGLTFVNGFGLEAVARLNEAYKERKNLSPVPDDITGHWAEDNINKLLTLNAITGYPDGSFNPDNNITRAEFAAVLVKAFKLTPQSGKIYGDTAEHWAKDYITTAVSYGMMNGYDANTFGPDDLITREQTAVMIVRAAKLPKVSEDIIFTDSADISTWARDAVATAVKNRNIKGYPDNTFKPKGTATRAEAVTVIVNAIK